jgi:hypothetical protein
MPFDGTNFERRVDRDVAILKSARAGIAQPGGWCQGGLLRSRRGELTSRCAKGWLAHAGGYKRADDLELASDRLLAPALPLLCRLIDSRVSVYNDAPRRTQKQMVALFDRAIRLVEERARTLALA